MCIFFVMLPLSSRKCDFSDSITCFGRFVFPQFQWHLTTKQTDVVFAYERSLKPIPVSSSSKRIEFSLGDCDSLETNVDLLHPYSEWVLCLSHPLSLSLSVQRSAFFFRCNNIYLTNRRVLSVCNILIFHHHSKFKHVFVCMQFSRLSVSVCSQNVEKWTSSGGELKCLHRLWLHFPRLSISHLFVHDFFRTRYYSNMQLCFSAWLARSFFLRCLHLCSKRSFLDLCYTFFSTTNRWTLRQMTFNRWRFNYFAHKITDSIILPIEVVLHITDTWNRAENGSPCERFKVLDNLHISLLQAVQVSVFNWIAISKFDHRFFRCAFNGNSYIGFDHC